jgi:hypothetical protein
MSATPSKAAGALAAYSLAITRAEKAEREAKQLRADAARYRWLRDQMPASIGSLLSSEPFPCDPDALDVTIDAAIDAARGAK